MASSRIKEHSELESSKGMKVMALFSVLYKITLAVGRNETYLELLNETLNFVIPKMLTRVQTIYLTNDFYSQMKGKYVIFTIIGASIITFTLFR